jgi:hypothetical protein
MSVLTDINILKEWAYNYIKNKDAFLKNIISIDNAPTGLLVKYKNKDQIIITSEKLDIKLLKKKKESDNLFIFTYNTKNNLESLISMWDSIIKYKSLSICFVNQESKLEKRWIIHPYTHNKISERSALKQGLMSLFQTVETKH